MRDIKLTNSHDLVVESGDMSFVDDAEEILQAVRIRLLAIQTESVYDYTMGLPWFDDMFNPDVPTSVKEGLLKQVILDTPGVYSIERFLFNLDHKNSGVIIECDCRIVVAPFVISVVVEVSP